MPELMPQLVLKLRHELGFFDSIEMEFVLEFAPEFMPEMPISKGYLYHFRHVRIWKISGTNSGLDFLSN